MTAALSSSIAEPVHPFKISACFASLITSQTLGVTNDFTILVAIDWTTNLDIVVLPVSFEGFIFEDNSFTVPAEFHGLIHQSHFE